MRAEEAPFIVGVDIGGTKIAAVVASTCGEVQAFCTVPTDTTGNYSILRGILQALEQAVDQAQVPWERIAAVGIGAPGSVEIGNGIWAGSTNVRLTSAIPVVRVVEDRFGRPAFLENDVKAAALGELRFGIAQGLRHMVYFSIGTGIAAGVVINGRLYRGVGKAGEIGHAPVERNGPLCNCGTRGCLEMMASGASIARRARAALQGGRETVIARLAGGEPLVVTARMVFEAAALGDLVAEEIIEETVSYLAMGVLMAFAAYDPQLLVIGGGMAQAGDRLLNPLRRAISQQSGPSSAHLCDRIVLTSLGDRTGALGAVAVALQALESKGVASISPHDRTEC